MLPNVPIVVQPITHNKRICIAVKKRHTVKNTIMSTVTKWIVFVGRTFSGHEHDYNMLKTEFPPEHFWFESIHALVDLGYQGILDDYRAENIEIPHRKPRKSKKNPLTE